MELSRPPDGWPGQHISPENTVANVQRKGILSGGSNYGKITTAEKCADTGHRQQIRNRAVEDGTQLKDEEGTVSQNRPHCEIPLCMLMQTDKEVRNFLLETSTSTHSVRYLKLHLTTQTNIFTSVYFIH